MGRFVANPVQMKRIPMGLARRHVTTLVDAVHSDARRRIGVRSGQAKARTYGSVWLVGTQVRGEVGTRVRYAKWHHDGTQPHVIRARRAPALRFYWPKAGKVVYFASVNHPGTRPTLYLTTPLLTHGTRMGFKVTFGRGGNGTTI